MQQRVREKTLGKDLTPRKARLPEISSELPFVFASLLVRPCVRGMAWFRVRLRARDLSCSLFMNCAHAVSRFTAARVPPQ